MIGNPGLVQFSIILKAPREIGWQFKAQHFLVTLSFCLSSSLPVLQGPRWRLTNLHSWNPLGDSTCPTCPKEPWYCSGHYIHGLSVIGSMTGLQASRAEVQVCADSSPTEAQWMSSFIFSGCFFVNSIHRSSLDLLIKNALGRAVWRPSEDALG